MSAKPVVKSKIITLRLSRDTLLPFPHEQPVAPSPASKAASSSDAPDTPAAHTIEPPSADTPADSTANMNGTSTPSLAPPGANSKRKGPKPGTKRSAAVMEGATSGSTPKPRGRPGPKKKKLGDIINDPNDKAPFAAPAAANKLGPKANQGAINANLRALDRTGKFKCRKWEKKGFKLRSFTGVVWGVPSWKAPERMAASFDDVKSDSTGSSDTKLKDESSAISDGLNGDGGTPVPASRNGFASSPAPTAAV